jgi:hypothetical protein
MELLVLQLQDVKKRQQEKNADSCRNTLRGCCVAPYGITRNFFTGSVPLTFIGLFYKMKKLTQPCNLLLNNIFRTGKPSSWWRSLALRENGCKMQLERKNSNIVIRCNQINVKWQVYELDPVSCCLQKQDNAWLINVLSRQMKMHFLWLGLMFINLPALCINQIIDKLL